MQPSTTRTCSTASHTQTTHYTGQHHTRTIAIWRAFKRHANTTMQDNHTPALQVYCRALAHLATGRVRVYCEWPFCLIAGHVAVIQVADKGSAMKWEFCSLWVWDGFKQCLTTEGYSTHFLTFASSVKERLCLAVEQGGWPINEQASIPLLYIIAKANFLSTCSIVPSHCCSRTLLDFATLVAGTFALFLRTLVHTIPASFLCCRVADPSPWVAHLPSCGCPIIGKADCTQQFDKISPTQLDVA